MFLVALVVVFAILEPRFLTERNILNLLRQVSIPGVIAIGMTFVILTAGIDLSVGSLVALSGVTAAALAKGGTDNTLSLGAADSDGYGVVVAILGALLVGLIAGGVQGAAITKLKVPPFVVTLGGLSAFRGLTLLVSNGPISGFDDDYQWLGQGRLLFDIPVPIVVFAVLAIVASLTLRRTRFGRHVYAVGANPEAALFAGLNVERIRLAVYTIAGACAGLGGYLLSSRLNSAEAVAGQGFELDVIAAVVIGGTSLFGGEGSIERTVLGVLLIGVLSNGLVLMDVSSFTQQIIIGVLIVAAVAFERLISTRSA